MLTDFNLREAIRSKMHERLSRNYRISYRQVAKEIGVSTSTLSAFLNGETQLSFENSQKVLLWLDCDTDFQYLYTLANFLPVTKSLKIKESILKKINFLQSKDVLESSEKVHNLLQTCETSQLLIYLKSPKVCSQDRRVCFRILHLLKDKTTGQASPHFYEVFFDTQINRVDGAFFIKQEEGHYTAYSTLGKIARHISYIENPINKKIDIEFNDDGLPHILNFKTLRKDKKEEGLMNLKFETKYLEMTGQLFTNGQPDSKKNRRYIYERTF